MESFGKQFSLQVRMKFLGTTEKDTAKILVKELNLPVTPEKMLDLLHEAGYKVLDQVELMPGVVSFAIQ